VPGSGSLGGIVVKRRFDPDLELVRAKFRRKPGPGEPGLDASGIPKVEAAFRVVAGSGRVVIAR